MGLVKNMMLRYQVSQKMNRVERMNKRIDELTIEGKATEANKQARKAESITEKITQSIKESVKK